MSRLARKVVGIEYVPEAIADAKINSAVNLPSEPADGAQGAPHSQHAVYAGTYRQVARLRLSI